MNGLATNHALASRIARETVSFGRVRPLEERLAAIARVTRGRRAARGADLSGRRQAQPGARGEAARREEREAVLSRLAWLLLPLLAAWRLRRPARLGAAPAAGDRRAGGASRARCSAPSSRTALRILVLEDHRLPRIALSLTVRRGEASLAPSQAGLASFTAELMKRGAGERDALALASAVDEIGASLAVERRLGLDGRRRRRPLPRRGRAVRDPRRRGAAAALRPARGACARAASGWRSSRGAKDDPATLVSWHAARALYPGHRYGVPAEGTPESVARFDAAHARDLHRRYFVPNDAVLAAVGDVEAQDVIARARQAFGAWPRGPVVPPGEPPPAQAPPGAARGGRRSARAGAGARS